MHLTLFTSQTKIFVVVSQLNKFFCSDKVLYGPMETLMTVKLKLNSLQRLLSAE